VAKNPLAEVFGYPTDNQSPEAQRSRALKLCPFNNRVPQCTKDSLKDPLGTCSILHYSRSSPVPVPAITCPVRFREGWQITADAAAFFFPPGTLWEQFSEVRLVDAVGKRAGNIDIVLVAHDGHGAITDIGGLEVQSVYISGTIGEAFHAYLATHTSPEPFDWSGQPNFPHPDYLSSSRKRLEPQLRFKGSILKRWGIKQAVAIHQDFYATLPSFDRIAREDADLAWLIYDLALDSIKNRYTLVLKDTVYTRYAAALMTLTTPKIGERQDFERALQARLRRRLAGLESPAEPLVIDAE
jgi:hypothetical protein